MQTVCLRQNLRGEKKLKNKNMNSTWNTRRRELRGDVTAPEIFTKRNIRNKILVSNTQYMQRGNQPGESLLWFDSICINPPNYAFNKWSSPRELPVHSRLAYSRQHNHRLENKKKRKKEKERKGKERREKEKEKGGKGGMRANWRNSRGEVGYQTDLFALDFIFSNTAINSCCWRNNHLSWLPC